jgi:hypothetical protein
LRASRATFREPDTGAEGREATCLRGGTFTALPSPTRESATRREFGRSSFLYADGKAILIDEDGGLALARISPEGIEVLARSPVFQTTSWTVPTLVGTTLYARDREKIVALDPGAE